MDRKLIVGDVVILKDSLLMMSCPIGTKGCVYEEYDIGDGPGAGVIFENGTYDGFSPEDQESFFDFVAHCDECEDYVFRNVMQLSRDYDKGLFLPAFTFSG